MTDFDAIVVGSGAGGLTAALCLAQAGQRVIVLEQHYLPGGWCHSFSLEGHRFSPGVHYIGELGPGGRMRALYEGLGVADDLMFFELPRTGFDHVLIGGYRPFDIPAGRDELERRLCERFPDERDGIHGYLTTVEAISRQLDSLLDVHGVVGMARLPWQARSVVRWGLSTLDSLLDRYVSDPALRAILAIQCGDHGLPPSRAPAPLHAAIAGHYFGGGWYPRGGGGALPRAFIRALRRAGGDIRVRAPVERILVEGTGRDRKVVGVRLADGEVLRSNVVVSNADPHVTLRGLLGEEHLGVGTRARLALSRWSISCVSLYLAVDMDLEAAGYDAGNYWYNRTPDLEATYRVERGAGGIDQDELPGLFLTITTLKDPTKRRGGLHTVEAFAFVPYDTFRPYAGSVTGARPPGYEALKERVIATMLRTAERIIPGLSEHVRFVEMGTPLTNVHYMAGHEGNVYGIEKNRFQIGPFAYPVTTDVPGLLMCGASTTGHGVMGATLSGMVAAAKVLHCEPRDLLRDHGQKLRTARSDDPSTWPEGAGAGRPKPLRERAGVGVV